jgi:signal transduction histidine kinase
VDQPALLVLALATAGIVVRDLIVDRIIDWEEFAELPLVTIVVLATVWHARRRQAAFAQLRELAASEHALRQSEHALREQERDFSRQASHELRSPLTLARGHVQLVQAAMPAGPMSADLDVVLRQLDRVTAITTRLLTIGSIEQPATLSLESVDVDTLVHTMVELWSRSHRRGWLVSGDAAVLAKLDQTRFAAALDELLDNAVKHTADADTIQVVVRHEGTDLVITVSDSGTGLPAGSASRVFDPFWRGPEPRHHGAGLGLSIVKAAAAVHGGDAYVLDAAGPGATFVMVYPGAVRPVMPAVSAVNAFRPPRGRPDKAASN